MNYRLELFMRTLAIFLATFFTSRWYSKNRTNLSLFIFAFVLGIFLNFYGPLKL